MNTAKVLPSAGSDGIDPPELAGDTDEIRAALDHLLAQHEFEASERRRAFLRYIVEETLAGRAARLKGYTIGQEVFDRGEDFDAQSDPVVRLEARRLRRDLDGYYVGAGAQDRIRISIPKGGYVPQFDWHGPAAARVEQPADAEPPAPDAAPPETVEIPPEIASTRKGRPWRVIVLGALVVAVLAIAAFFLLTGRNDTAQVPGGTGVARIEVLPFDSTDRSEISQVIASGLSWEIVNNLTGFQSLRVFQARQAADSQPEPSGQGGSYELRGGVMTEAQTAEISVQLLDATSKEIIWAKKYAVTLDPGALIATRNDISATIANLIAQPYGPIASSLEKSAQTTRPREMESYLCLLQAYDYRRDFSAAKFAPVLQCLEETVRRQPDYSDAVAMLALLHLDGARYEFLGRENREGELAAAHGLAERAVKLAPESSFALSVLSSVDHHMGNYDEAERLAREALTHNPYDPDTLAQLGWRLAARGNFEEGVPYLQEAIDRSVNPPGWYFNLIAINYLMRGEYAKMLNVAERAAADGGQFSIALVAMAAAGLGDVAKTRDALSRLSPDALFARDPEEFIRNHGTSDDIAAALLAAYQHARDLAG